MFQKMRADEPDNWQPIDEDTLRRELAGYYRDIDEIVLYIQAGGKARTPWSFYRSITKAGAYA